MIFLILLTFHYISIQEFINNIRMIKSFDIKTLIVIFCCKYTSIIFIFKWFNMLEQSFSLLIAGNPTNSNALGFNPTLLGLIDLIFPFLVTNESFTLNTTHLLVTHICRNDLIMPILFIFAYSSNMYFYVFYYCLKFKYLATLDKLTYFIILIDPDHIN